MEILKFETAIASSIQMERMESIMASIPNIIEWCIDSISNHTLLSIKGIRIKAIDIVNELEGHGIPATQVFEE